MRIGAAVAALLLAGSAAAQPLERRGAPAGAFDFYVLALSWSPGFCEAEGDAKGRDQCATGAGLGFVVHGLWPQFERGYPSFCEPEGRNPSRPALAEAAGLFPDEGLARYQWRKHGSCAGGRSCRLLPRCAPRARTRPGAGSAERSGLAHESRAARHRARFRRGQSGFEARDDGGAVPPADFQEIRICLNRDLRGFRACPEVDRDACRAGEIAVPAPR
jgi:ribonuclease T2